MDVQTYQDKALETAVYGEDICVSYPALGLASEVGEVLGILKKIYRDDEGWLTPTLKQKLELELGDVLWYVAALAADLGLSLGEIAEKNIAKLHGRRERGTLQGSGDDR